MLIRRGRRALAAGLVAAFLLLVAACSDDDDGGATDASAESAESETDDADDSDDDDADADAGDGDGETLTGEEIGQLIANSMVGTARTSISAEGPAAMEGEGVVDFSTDPPRMAMSMTSAGQQMEMVLIDGSLYMTMAETGCIVVGTDDESLSQLGLENLADNMDPAGTVELYAEGVLEASHRGKATVDGEEMDHYTMVIDPVQLDADAIDPEVAEMMPDDFAAQLWFDSDGHMRQMEMDTGPGGVVTAKYFDYGASVSVEAPSGDCQDFGAVMGEG